MNHNYITPTIDTGITMDTEDTNSISSTASTLLFDDDDATQEWIPDLHDTNEFQATVGSLQTPQHVRYI